jgi:8-oxo-dGTP diphosphatase
VNYIYDYPRPMVTVDMLVWRYREEKVEILLIRRDRPPLENQWALPGGFIKMDETLLESAKRELAEETGIKDVDLFSLTIAGNPERDPRGRTITALFTGFFTEPFGQVRAGDDARNAEWFAVNRLPKLAFDHAQLIRDATNELAHRLYWQLWILMFFLSKIVLSDLKKIGRFFWNKADSSENILHVAEHLNLVRRDKTDSWRRTASNQQIVSLPAENLIKAWQSAG